MGAVRGEYLHMRCDRHEVSGHFQTGGHASYRCEHKGCDWPARAYWYRGEQYQKLPASEPMVAYG
jgi:hypothetical protein